MKENPHKQVEYQIQGSTTKKEDERLSHAKQGEYQDCINSLDSLSILVDDVVKTGDIFVGLKRHWKQVGGRICVPERWGHEASMREWIDYSSFDKILAPNGLKSARDALISQAKRARSTSTMWLH